MRKTRFLEVAGVLTIISSCFALFTSLLHLSNILGSSTPWFGDEEPIFFWLAFINCFGFPLGLTGGILALLRQHFILATSGMGILLSAHVLSVILPVYKYPQYFLSFNLGWGTPLIIASALGLMITIKNREAFS